MPEENEGVKETSTVATQSDSPADGSGQGTNLETSDQSSVAQPSQSEEANENGSEQQSKKGANSRIRDLVSERDAERQKAESLAKQIEKLTGASQEPQFQFDPLPPRNESDEITAEELEERVLHKAMTLNQIERQREYHAKRIQSEANKVMKDHPQLDPDNKEEFDQDLSDAITEAGLAYIKANPTQSFEKYVNKMMKPYERAVAKQVGNLADTVTKQAAETALRPSSSPKGGEKRPEDMSIEELEEHLGTVV